MQKWVASFALSIRMPSSRKRVRVNALRRIMRRMVKTRRCRCPPILMSKPTPTPIPQIRPTRRRRLRRRRRKLVPHTEIPIHILRVKLAPRRRRTRTRTRIPVLDLLLRLDSLGSCRRRPEEVRTAPAGAWWRTWWRRGCAARAGAYCEVGGGTSIWGECVVRVFECGEGGERAVQRRTQYYACVCGVSASDAHAHTCC